MTELTKISVKNDEEYHRLLRVEQAHMWTIATMCASGVGALGNLLGLDSRLMENAAKVVSEFRKMQEHKHKLERKLRARAMALIETMQKKQKEDSACARRQRIEFLRVVVKEEKHNRDGEFIFIFGHGN